MVTLRIAGAGYGRLVFAEFATAREQAGRAAWRAINYATIAVACPGNLRDRDGLPLVEVRRPIWTPLFVVQAFRDGRLFDAKPLELPSAYCNDRMREEGLDPVGFLRGIVRSAFAGACAT